jgi:hypothetical protein
MVLEFVLAVVSTITPLSSPGAPLTLTAATLSPLASIGAFPPFPALDQYNNFLGLSLLQGNENATTRLRGPAPRELFTSTSNSSAVYGE